MTKAQRLKKIDCPDKKGELIAVMWKKGFYFSTPVRILQRSQVARTELGWKPSIAYSLGLPSSFFAAKVRIQVRMICRLASERSNYLYLRPSVYLAFPIELVSR